MNFKNPIYYADVNLKQDLSYHDYENFEITFGFIYNISDQEKYNSIATTLNFTTLIDQEIRQLTND